MRRKKCTDPSCRNFTLRARTNICNKCKADNYLRYNPTNYTACYTLFKQMDTNDVEEFLKKEFENTNVVIIQFGYLAHFVSIPYLRILFGLSEKSDLNEIKLIPNFVYCVRVKSQNKHVVIIRFSNTSYIFAPANFKTTTWTESENIAS